MVNRYRVSGIVTYLNERAQRLTIPAGTIIEIEELESKNPAALMRWSHADGKKREQALSLIEFAQYTKTELKKVY